ncbi:hypothetical protein L3Q82_025415 [Scortum barcoo]|uniref:Uncharacterized protein n=1 Tax=Scortum barcoo TaxID=214431 RepID=A0ACB8WKY2_9TELE|nr:hypothetical protein L3Q82_025415 [Scortum barcoo]
MCFVDLEKAFDRVPRGILWGVLQLEYGVRGPLLRAVRSLYDRSRSLVRIAGSKSDLFPVHVGLRQGCPLSPVLFIIFMDRISRRSQGPEGVRFGNHRISSLLFADDVVLLASSSQDLQHVLERFAAECEAAGMRISTSKSEAMVLDRKRVVCPLRVSGEVLPQVEEFKYLGVLFTSEGKMEREIDRRIGAASMQLMRSVYRTVVVKKELSRKEALDLPKVNLRSHLTYGHELWVMTERTRSRIQAAEMSFLRRVAGRSLRDRVRSSVIREELGVEPLLLRIERSQLRWLGHLFRMPPGRLPREVFQACPTGRRPREDPGHAGETMSLSWPGNASGSPGRAGGSVWVFVLAHNLIMAYTSNFTPSGLSVWNLQTTQHDPSGLRVEALPEPLLDHSMAVNISPQYSSCCGALGELQRDSVKLNVRPSVRPVCQYPSCPSEGGSEQRVPGWSAAEPGRQTDRHGGGCWREEGCLMPPGFTGN